MLDMIGASNVTAGQRASGLLQFCDGILCFGAEDWWYHNHGYPDMQIMRRLANKLPVLYVNSVGIRMPTPQEGVQCLYRIGRKLGSVARRISAPFPGFYVASPFSVPLWHRRFVTKLNVLSLDLQVRYACRATGVRRPLLWVACPTAFEVAKRMRRRSLLIYQRHDKFEAYSEKSRDYLTTADKWLSEHADVILYSSRILYEEERDRKSRGILIGQGVELGHFDRDKALQAERPLELAGMRRPIAGFLGEIEEIGCDMELIGETARALPDVTFVFVGRLIADPGRVQQLPNVHFLGKKPYEEVPKYAVHFDVAIMPLPRNSWKYYSSPLKLKEYLALGLPIVSTAFPEAGYYKDVLYVASSGADFARGIRKAADGRGVGTTISRRARVAQDSWDHLTDTIADTIHKLAHQNAVSKFRQDPSLLF